MIASPFLSELEKAGNEGSDGHEKLPDVREYLRGVDACGRVSFDNHAEAKAAVKEVDERGFDMCSTEC